MIKEIVQHITTVIMICICSVPALAIIFIVNLIDYIKNLEYHEGKDKK